MSCFFSRHCIFKTETKTKTSTLKTETKTKTFTLKTETKTKTFTLETETKTKTLKSGLETVSRRDIVSRRHITVYCSRTTNTLQCVPHARCLVPGEKIKNTFAFACVAKIK